VKTSLGFRPHTGWTCVVALGDQLGTPVVIDRRRLELSRPGLPVQPYHAARKLPLERAADLIRRTEQTAHESAAAGLGSLLAGLQANGHRVVGAGVPRGTADIPSSLERVLASHTLSHAAEGEMFRRVLLDAAVHHGLRVSHVPTRELLPHARAVLGYDEQTIRQALADLGRAVGPPWRQDEKDAALAAWLALATAPS
jgi:hypothetical protein